MSEATLQALNGLRDFSMIKWYVIPLLALVFYVYNKEIRLARNSGNWNAVLAGATIFGMDFFNETNKRFLEESFVAPEYDWDDEPDEADDIVAMDFQFRGVDLLVDYNEQTGDIVSIYLPAPDKELYDILPDEAIRRIENAVRKAVVK
jgi:hypothetical protein